MRTLLYNYIFKVYWNFDIILIYEKTLHYFITFINCVVGIFVNNTCLGILNNKYSLIFSSFGCFLLNTFKINYIY